MKLSYRRLHFKIVINPCKIWHSFKFHQTKHSEDFGIIYGLCLHCFLFSFFLFFSFFILLFGVYVGQLCQKGNTIRYFNDSLADKNLRMQVCRDEKNWGFNFSSFPVKPHLKIVGISCIFCSQMWGVLKCICWF